MSGLFIVVIPRIVVRCREKAVDLRYDQISLVEIPKEKDALKEKQGENEKEKKKER